MPYARLFDFVVDEPADPEEVDAEFNQIIGALNLFEATKAWLTGGTFTGQVLFNQDVFMTGSAKLTLLSEGTDVGHVVSKGYVDTKLSLLGGTVLGGLHIFHATDATLYLENSTGPITEWAIQATGEKLIFYYNIGTHGTPNYQVRYTLNKDGYPSLNTDLAPKLFVTDAISMGYAEAIKTDGDYGTTHSGNFEGVPGAIANITLVGVRRVQVSVIATLFNSVGANSACLGLIVDGVPTGILSRSNSNDSGIFNGGFTYVTPPMAIGAHSIQLGIFSESGDIIAVLATVSNPLIVQAREILTIA